METTREEFTGWVEDGVYDASRSTVFWLRLLNLWCAPKHRRSSSQTTVRDRFPHATCLYPAVQETMRESIDGLAPLIQHKLLYESVARTYEIPVIA